MNFYRAMALPEYPRIRLFEMVTAECWIANFKVMNGKKVNHMKRKEHEMTQIFGGSCLGLTCLLAVGIGQAGGLTEESIPGSDPYQILSASAPAVSVMNDAGDRAENRMTEDGRTRAYLLDRNGREIDLGALGGKASMASAINPRRQVAGSSETANAETHAFLWQPVTGMLDLGTLGGADSSATGVDQDGRVLGVSLTPGGQSRAFLWRPHRGMFNLDLTDGRLALAGEPEAATDDGAAGQDATARPMASSCPYAGAYKGRATGPWSIKIDAGCQVKGRAINDVGYSLSLRGRVDEEGAFVVSGSTGAVISGNIAPNGYITGTWYSSGDSGNVSGRYVSTPKLSRLNPKQARAGDFVTVTGKDFWFVPGQVTFGKTTAEIVSWESARITVVAPDLGAGAQGKKVKLKVRSLNGKGSNVKTFRLLP